MRAQVQPGELMVDDAMRFDRNVLAAVKGLARAKPWRGSVEERKEKFLALARELAEAGGFTLPAITFGNVEANTCSGTSCYIRREHRVLLTGRLSVVTLLRMLAYASGMHDPKATKWTINIFRRCFPISFRRCRFEGYMLRRESAIIV